MRAKVVYYKGNKVKWVGMDKGPMGKGPLALIRRPYFGLKGRTYTQLVPRLAIRTKAGKFV